MVVAVRIYLLRFPNDSSPNGSYFSADLASVFKKIGPSVRPHADGLLATAPGCTLDYVLSFTVVAPTHRHSM